VANATEVRLLGGLIHGRDLHEVLKIAQPSSPRLHLREAQQRSIVSLPVDQSGIDPRFEAQRRMPENSPALARWTAALVADLAVAPSAAHP